MLRDFVNQASAIQEARLDEWVNLARRDAVRQEARAARRLRRAVGHKLIALGERMADEPRPTRETMDTAA